MKFNDNTVAIGLRSWDGQTQIIELKSVNQARGMSLDQIILIKPLTSEEELEWYQCYMPCMTNSPFPRLNRIAKLHK